MANLKLSFTSKNGAFVLCATTKGTSQMTLSERIWGALRGAVDAIAETFGLTDEEVFEGLTANGA